MTPTFICRGWLNMTKLQVLITGPSALKFEAAQSVLIRAISDALFSG